MRISKLRGIVVYQPVFDVMGNSSIRSTCLRHLEVKFQGLKDFQHLFFVIGFHMIFRLFQLYLLFLMIHLQNFVDIDVLLIQDNVDRGFIYALGCFCKWVRCYGNTYEISTTFEVAINTYPLYVRLFVINNPLKVSGVFLSDNGGLNFLFLTFFGAG